ncbi:MAG: hypothetical protein AB1746_10100 [Candidatus Zixiibacteriota bacterium]
MFSLFIRFAAFVIIIISYSCLPADAGLEKQPVCVAKDRHEFLKLVPVCNDNGYMPLLYNDEKHTSASIEKFLELYEGEFCNYDFKDSNPAISDIYSGKDSLILCPEDMRFAAIASAIASHMQIPLYFDSDTLPKNAGRRYVIIIGSPVKDFPGEVIRLETIESAQSHYNNLAGNKSMAVLINDDDYSFLAAAVAAHHDCLILLNLEEITLFQPRYLAWVTVPKTVTKEKVKELYRACRFSEASRVYDAGVGILTGLDAEDVSLLIARAYSYSAMSGEWKYHLVNAALPPHPRDSQEIKGYAEIILNDTDFTCAKVRAAMQNASYLFLYEHGGPSGFAMVGEGWPNSGKIPDFPPFVFAAEACLTGDITGSGVNASIALRSIAAGAVAYIGSMEMGGVAVVEKAFAFCTPDFPISEHVRLQNAARMDVDADWPRSILIGEPTFHQLDNEIWESIVRMDDNKAYVSVKQDEINFESSILLILPDTMSVAYAKLHQDGKDDELYMAGSFGGGKSITSLPAFGKQTVMMDWPGGSGELVLYRNMPFGVAIKNFMLLPIMGWYLFLDNMMTMGDGEYAIFIISILVLAAVLYAQERKKFHEYLIALLSGLGLAVVILLFYMFFGSGPVIWPAVIGLGIAAATAAMLVPVRHSAFKWVSLSTIVYTAPIIITLLFLISRIPVNSNHIRFILYGFLLFLFMTVLDLTIARFIGLGVHRMINRPAGKKSIDAEIT